MISLRTICKPLLVVLSLMMVVPSMAQDEASVHFVREKKRKGASLNFVVMMGGLEMGVLRAGHTLKMPTPPPKDYSITCKVKTRSGATYSKADLSIRKQFETIQSGKSYYYLFDVDISGTTGDLTIEPISASRFREISSVEEYEVEAIPPHPLLVGTASQSQTTGSSRRVGVEQPIQIIQPSLEGGDKVIFRDPRIMVKGRIDDRTDVREVLVNNEKAVVNDDGYFEKEIRVGYTDNLVVVRLLTAQNQFFEKQFTISRPFDPNSPEYLGLSRHGKDYALLFATNQFEDFANLTNPVFDATTIATELEENYSFEVELVTNPSQDEILSKIREYAKKLYSDEDQLFVFFAGHGEFDEFFGEGYIVAKDSEKDDAGKASYISHSRLRTILNNIDCKHILLTMDVCFGGTFDPVVAARGEEDYENVERSDFIQRKMKYLTRLYLTSGGKEYVPDGRPNQHSPFARRFIAALRSAGGVDGILTYNEILTYVEKVNPEPRSGEFGNNEPGSDFLFIYNDPER